MRTLVAGLLLLTSVSCASGRSTVADETPLVPVATRLLEDPRFRAAQTIPVCVGNDGFDFSPSPATLEQLRALDPRVVTCRNPENAGAVYLRLRTVEKPDAARYLVGAGLYCATAHFGGADCTDHAIYTVEQANGEWRVTSR